MEKTEMMKRYEEEKKKDANDELYSGSVSLYLPTVDYIAWLEAKAEAYDELMQRQVTMQELANITNRPVAVSEDCTKFIVFSNKPDLEDFCCGEEEGDHLAWIGERLFSITLKEEYDGCWWTSLTLPDRWEAQKC